VCGSSFNATQRDFKTDLETVGTAEEIDSTIDRILVMSNCLTASSICDSIKVVVIDDIDDDDDDDDVRIIEKGCLDSILVSVCLQFLENPKKPRKNKQNQKCYKKLI